MRTTCLISLREIILLGIVLSVIVVYSADLGIDVIGDAARSTITVSAYHLPENPATTDTVTIYGQASDPVKGIKYQKIYIDGLDKKTCYISLCDYSSTYTAGKHSYYVLAVNNDNKKVRTPSKYFTVSDTYVKFAVIGDYGFAGLPETEVANLVKTWKPDFIITTGDNNYPSGSSSTIDQNIGQYYYDYIYPYTGSYGSGSATENRFWPSMGNHDWNSVEGSAPYTNYFALPNNERYYDYIKWPVHFFVIDSDGRDPDGTSSASVQGTWLQNKLAAATEPWKIVYFHHPPYSSGAKHGSTAYMQWPLKEWGADVVLSGHEHNYERLYIGNLVYFVNGAGGNNLYSFGTPINGSQFRYNSAYGAQLVTASSTELTFKFINTKGRTIDAYTMIH